MLLDTDRILWIKSVRRSDGILAYVGQDDGALHCEPTDAGDEFEVHTSLETADSLGRPEVGDLLCLTQHGLLTHLVEVIGHRVQPRPPKETRRGIDAHYPRQRTCRVIALATAKAPRTTAALGFDPGASGGRVYAIDDLIAFRQSGLHLAEVQAKIVAALGLPRPPGPGRPGVTRRPGN